MTPASSNDYGPQGRSAWMDIDWRSHQRWVRVEDRWANVIEIGSGPPVLFVHGLGGSWQNWLESIGLPFDELYCSFDKVARCREIGIELLIDDSPVNLQHALDAGIRAATIVHPWNRDLCETEDVICAADWPGLEAALAPVLADR